MHLNIQIYSYEPTSPVVGDSYFDRVTQTQKVYTGSNWVELSGLQSVVKIENLIPTKEDLEKHPSIKQAWDEYLVIRKLLGL